jgi:hypothetical protein
MTRTLSPLELSSIRQAADLQARVGDDKGAAASLSLLGLEARPASPAYGNNPVAPGTAGSYNEALNLELLGQRFTKYRVEGAPAQSVLNQNVDVDQAPQPSRIWELLIAGVVILVLSRYWK